MEVIMVILPLILIGFIYFIPSYIASKKNKHNKILIYIINFFLGWSLFGWFAALFLALKKDHRDQLSINNKGLSK
ncbi:superinfection immunity protein [Rossellomorea aquimaris]|uniref:Superinfection immunity protein n=1 Tax=Rossellomorea aquimaris TaxID=189382 RepID=A0A5D4U3I7_9BACI|nr:superinfection immunity protein [Rossellomorea aquimaris]TYS81761.1 superinfection immunity protein [Rossellomorea aquimaris]TYS88385.1 superinfection immunity protein [Rossellomorea aquimaris]